MANLQELVVGPTRTSNMPKRSPTSPVKDLKLSGPLPLHGSYIIFPLQQVSIVNVEWAQSDCWHSAPYYQIRCFWSHDPGFTETTSTASHSVIFIAQEYFEERYLDSNPILKFAATKHVRNTDSLIWDHIGDSAKLDEKWARAKLTEDFCFGQNQAKTFRWMVYHPKERTIYQGRFLKGLRQLTLERSLGALGMIKASGPALFGGVTFNFDEAAISRLAKLGLTLGGDELHEFKPNQLAPVLVVGKVVDSLVEQEKVRAEYLINIKQAYQTLNKEEVEAAASLLMGARGEFYVPEPAGCSLM